MRIDKVKFKCAMAIADMSYGTLCEKTGYSRSHIYNIREGKSCNEVEATKIAEALGTTVDKIKE